MTTTTHARLDWRAIVARLPLPMLALSASYGVWSFNLLFVPMWVAFVSAAAFELTYLGLAVARIDERQRRRATVIAASAVVVSVLYNVVSGLFHRRPELLDNPSLWLDVALAVLHGLPLAVVAYNVSVLLLHADTTPAQQELVSGALMPQPIYNAPALARIADQAQQDEQAFLGAAPEATQVTLKTTQASRYQCPNCNIALSLGQYGAAKRHGYCRQCKAK